MEGEGGRPGHEEGAQELGGLRAVYRIGFEAMLVDGLPEQFTFGGAMIRHTMEGITTNRTLIVQQPGLRLEWVKTREGVEIGAGIPMRVRHIPFEVSANLVIDFAAIRERALGVMGTLSALLDERMAQEELFDDANLIDRATEEQVSTVDAALRVRSFNPACFLTRKSASWTVVASAPTSLPSRLLLLAGT